MKIGVVTPTHLGRDRAFLERAVRSVRDQTLPASGHFIVCDTERNGAAYTRQVALEANPFEWTAFLDSDDWFMPEHLDVLARFARETDADYVYSWYVLAYGSVDAPMLLIDRDPVFPPGHFLDPWDPEKPRHTTITVMVKTALAREVGFITVPDNGEIAHRQGEDWEFTLGCNRLGKIAHIPQRTWMWHHHGLNSSGIPGRGDA